MSDLDRFMLITGAVVLVVAIGLYFLAGTYHPKKDHAIIIEKLGLYEATLTKGTKFYLPVKYRCVGYYCLKAQTRTVKFPNDIVLEMTYQIVDSKKYHYSGIKVEDMIRKIRKENSELTLAILKDSFKEIGVDFINLKKPL